MFSIYSDAPTVSVIGITQPVTVGFDEYFIQRDRVWGRDDPYTSESIAVFAGAICYDSFHNPAHRTDEEYLQQQIVGNSHQSVIEHVVINFALAHLPRSTQLELIRHRVGTGFSFRSQRFTDDWLEYVEPPLYREQSNIFREAFYSRCRLNYDNYQNVLATLDVASLGDDVGRTLRRKRVKEAARAELPNEIGSDGVLSLNARALRHILKMRSDEHAEAGIREFTYSLYKAALPLIPAILADVREEAVDFGAPRLVLGA